MTHTPENPISSENRARRFVLRELDDRITVGPQGTVREGVIRVMKGEAAETFIFSGQKELRTSGGVYLQDPGQINEEFELPAQAVGIPGVRVFYNLEAAWLRVERIFEPKPLPIEITVDFPGDKPLKSLMKFEGNR
ncbi:MAG: hypothetical protein AAB383_01850 [Patescibacteria group bacterium]